jgi:CzcA family heavy metal efflux pump
MMRWIVGSSLKGRFLVLTLAGMLIFFGAIQLRNAPVDVFPEFAPPRVEVQTPSLGLSAAEVESLVTVPLEQSLNGLPELDTIRSKSVNDLSSIELIFKTGTDLLSARQYVQERVGALTHTLPTWASPPFILQPLSATSRVMKIGVSSKNVSLVDMSMTAYWTMRARLLTVPGVANIAIWGERIDMQQVQADPVRMQAAGVSIDEVMETTSKALEAGLLHFSDGARIGTGGFIDTPNQRLAVQNVLPILSPDDLAKVPIERKDGPPVVLGDVANMVRGHQPLIGDAVINDGPGLMLIVEKFPWGNALDVTKGVEAALDEMRPGLPGIEIDTTIFRPATFVESAINNLGRSLLIGALLMVLMLGLFLWDWRTALISVTAIPLSVITVGLVLEARGYTINTMILAGLVIALGDVVDDAIVDVENVFRRLKQHRLERRGKSAARVILEASLEVRSAIVYATLIEVAAVTPVLFLSGLSGAFFRPLALSYALAILASMAVALTVTPALCLILLRNALLERRESPFVRWLQPRYSAVLHKIIKRPRRAFAATGVIALAGFAVLPLLGQSLLPDFKERDFLMHWVTRPGTSVAEMQRITTDVSNELRAVPGVRNFGAHIGQALLADEVVGVDSGENWISIDPGVDYEQTVQAINNVVNRYPGIYRDVQTYLNERIHEVLTGSSDSITVRLFGDDLAKLRAKAQEVKTAISTVDGSVEAKVELQTDVPQVEVEVNLEAAQRYGLKPGDVRRAAGVLVAGEEVGDIFRQGKAYDVNVWSTPETRQNLTSIKNLLIDTPTGTKVRMGEVAEVRLVPTPNAIKHEDTVRRIDVSTNVKGRDLGSVAKDVQGRIDKVDFPLGYHAELLGEYAEREAAQEQILLIAIAAAIAILVLLQASFGNWRLATLAFLTLPFALVGGFLAAWAAGGILSLGSLVGLFTVFGIAARNGIMLVSHYHHLEEHEGEPFGPGLIVRGAMERLRPILMTALATALAVLPLVVLGNLPGHEIEHPMAVAIVGGLVTSTLLNLFVLPSLYLRFGKPKRELADTDPERAVQ